MAKRPSAASLRKLEASIDRLAGKVALAVSGLGSVERPTKQDKCRETHLRILHDLLVKASVRAMHARHAQSP